MMKRLVIMLLAAAFGAALFVAQVAGGPPPRGPAKVYELQPSPIRDGGIETQIREGGWGEPDGSVNPVVIWGFPFPIIIVIGEAEAEQGGGQDTCSVE